MCISAVCARRSTTPANPPSSEPNAAQVTYSMRFSELWRTSTFRLTLLYGALFAIGTLTLLWLIYLKSAVYLTRRVDSILNTEADALLHSPRPGLRQRVIEDLTLNGDRTSVFGLFDAKGERLAGNLQVLPTALRTNGRPLEV